MVQVCITLGLALWLVGVGLVDFEVVVRMEWLHAYCVFMGGRTRRVRFQLPNEPVFEWEVVKW